MKEKDLDKLFKKYANKLYNTAYRIIKRREEAEEIVHDSFIKLMKQRQFMVEQQIEAWLSKTCIRASIDHLRKEKRHRLFTEEYEEYMKDSDSHNDDFWSGISEEYENVKLMDAIKEAIAQLSDGYRVVLTLYLIEGYDYQEIAQILNMKESTIRTQFMRGKTKFTENFKNKNNG